MEHETTHKTLNEHIKDKMNEISALISEALKSGEKLEWSVMDECNKLAAGILKTQGEIILHSSYISTEDIKSNELREDIQAWLDEFTGEQWEALLGEATYSPDKYLSNIDGYNYSETMPDMLVECGLREAITKAYCEAKGLKICPHCEDESEGEGLIPLDAEMCDWCKKDKGICVICGKSHNPEPTPVTLPEPIIEDEPQEEEPTVDEEEEITKIENEQFQKDLIQEDEEREFTDHEAEQAADFAIEEDTDLSRGK
jgi:hypothetical protein